ncbi:hypothetical protein Acr_00g0048390 [Actinidia rufa]|uniref:Uncharacterized protein n=1 Tax=Actinidia rufa TaxID=165716 RepID=A0A7J0DK16_9ERIC|nr:hypothetical protein Acr_00g0048390 [Actinidia rufa]
MERYLGNVGDIIEKIAIWRVSRNCWCRGGENLTMGEIDRVEIDQAKYSTSPKGEGEIAHWLRASSIEIAWRGPMLNVGLVLPRSRGFGDSVWPFNAEMGLHRTDVWRCPLSPLGRGDSPQITILSSTYQVLSIRSATQTLTIVREEFWGNSCPRNLQNASLDINHFDYAIDPQDLLLYYGCSEAIPNIANCNATSSNNNSLSFYETSDLTPAFNKSNVKCDISVNPRTNQTTAIML